MTLHFVHFLIRMPHAKAVVAGRTIADTDEYEVVEGNIYVWDSVTLSYGS